MAFRTQLRSLMLAFTTFAAVPAVASAQFTLTGHFVEQLPGGGGVDLDVGISQIDTDGRTLTRTTLVDCSATVTANCIDAAGMFTATNLPNGLYLITVFGGHIERVLNVSVNGDTNMGTIPLIRLPFATTVTIGDIPRQGGEIPVSARLRTRWSIPTIPITVRLSVSQQTANGSRGFIDLPSINVTWPSTLADSGFVPLAPIRVPANTPAGAQTCFQVETALAGQPDFVLGRGRSCVGKRP